MGPNLLTSFRPDRRRVLAGVALGAASWFARGAFAEALVPTPQMTEGPFYPTTLPLDKDNDLVILGDSLTPAVGEITRLAGRILSAAGEPVRNALVEIWQVDGNGVYLHPGSAGGDHRDKHFQGYGCFETDSKGQYTFRTVKPVPYPGRPAPHIHFAVSTGGKRVYTTQLFVKGAPGLERDGIYRSLRTQADRDAVTKEFKAVPDAKVKQLAANFDIVMGQTPREGEDESFGPPRGGRRPSPSRGRRPPPRANDE